MAEALPKYPDSDFSDDDQSPIDVAFNKASSHVRTITTKLSDLQLLELYGLYKQGTEGRCNTQKPGFFNLQGRQKWEAWKSVGDMPQHEAKVKYTQLVQKYDPDWSELSEGSSAGKSKETWVTVSSLRSTTPEPELVSNEMTLLDAARENCASRVAELLLKNPELKHEKDDGGLTALHWAADRDATEALTAAIKGGCHIQATDDSGQTPLHYAASCGNLKSAEILLEAGASPLAQDEDEATPIDLAADDEMRKLLLDYAVK